jgi:hypothetical protein
LTKYENSYPLGRSIAKNGTFFALFEQGGDNLKEVGNSCVFLYNGFPWPEASTKAAGATKNVS